MRIIDTHCHLNDDQLYPIVEEVIQRSKEAGVQEVYNASDSLPSMERVLELKRRFPAFCHAVLGIHPEFANESDEYFEKAYRITEENLSSIDAIGEIGLDYHYSKDPEYVSSQKKRFIEQIRLAKKYDRPIVIHARDADLDTFRIIQEEKPSSIDLHCYSGSSEMLQEYLKLPIKVHIGVGGVCTFKNARVIKEVIQKNDLSVLMTETDSPYLAPTPHRGERNEPAYIPLILNQIALLKGMNVNEVADMLYQNGKEFYERKRN